MVEEKYSTNLTKTKYVNDSKITDHYAIIPTGQGYENYNNLPQLQKDIYLVIVKRFLAIFYPPAEYRKIQLTIEVEMGQEKKETFYTSGRVCINKGFLEILKPNDKIDSKKVKSTNSDQNVEKNIENKEKSGDLEILKNLKKGQEILIKNFEIKEAETSPPNRYNSGSIILAMENAGKYDRKILVEQGINAKEVECAVLDDKEVKASTVGEIQAAEEFYSFDAKYNMPESKTIIPAEIKEEQIETIRKLAIKAFKAIDGKGLARVDFFIDKETEKIYINEINTMPGFTKISMYPKLFEAVGISYSDLLDKLVQNALK